MALVISSCLRIWSQLEFRTEMANLSNLKAWWKGLGPARWSIVQLDNHFRPEDSVRPEFPLIKRTQTSVRAEGLSRVIVDIDFGARQAVRSR